MFELEPEILRPMAIRRREVLGVPGFVEVMAILPAPDDSRVLREPFVVVDDLWRRLHGSSLYCGQPVCGRPGAMRRAFL